MIPPFIITKAASLFGPVAAKLTSPLVKWGAIAAGVVLLVVCTWWKTYDAMRTACEEERVRMVAVQAEESAKMSVQAHQMGSVVVREGKLEDLSIKTEMADVRKEVVSHAKKNPKPLTTATVAIYDKLIRVPNETAVSVPSADSGTGGPEVSRGRVDAETPLILRDEEGNEIGLTTEDLVQAATDFAEKYALMKNAYRRFSLWNDGREKIELERLQ